MKIPILPALLLCTLTSGPCLHAQAAAQLWEKRYNGPGNDNDYARAVAVDTNGNVVVTGYSIGSGTSTYDYYTAKYAAANGVLLWEKRYNGPVGNRDDSVAVALDASGNVAVTGTSVGLKGPDYYTAKYAATDGALLWEKRYNSPVNEKDQARAITLDASGNVIVTGTSIVSLMPIIASDYYTAKYAAADGALLWEKRYNATGTASGIGLSVGVDATQNVIVTGAATPAIASGSNYDYYTAKYAAATGALLWEKRYNGLGNGGDYPSGMAVDASGNAVVTGVSTGSGSTYDYYTAKYAAANGALLWERRYHGPGNGDDFARAVTVDASSNVIVTGGSRDSGNNLDYYTAKYAAVDGALLWEKRYNGPENGDDDANAVVVDTSGNVIVTGYSIGSESSNDYYTAKYAATDGALLWEMRFSGAGSSSTDFSRAIAVDGSGNVIITGDSKGNGQDYYTVKYSALPLVDYAFGLDPSNGSSQLPQWEVRNGTISTTFTQPPGIVSGITYGAEWTTDLTVYPWTPIPDSGTGGTHTFSVPIGPEPRKFFRFIVSQP